MTCETIDFSRLIRTISPMVTPQYLHIQVHINGMPHSECISFVCVSVAMQIKFLRSATWKRVRTSFQRNVKDYLLNSSMHGLKYIGDGSLSFSERIFFLISFAIVSFLSAYFISNLWQKWTENPIIIGMNSASTPLNEIPFPAVTICNMNQARRERARNISTNSLDGMLLESVCNLDDSIAFNSTSSPYVGKWAQFKEFLTTIAQPCKEMLK